MIFHLCVGSINKALQTPVVSIRGAASAKAHEGAFPHASKCATIVLPATSLLRVFFYCYADRPSLFLLESLQFLRTNT